MKVQWRLLAGLAVAFPLCASAQQDVSPPWWIGAGVSIGGVSAAATAVESSIGNSTTGTSFRVGVSVRPHWGLQLTAEHTAPFVPGDCVTTPAPWQSACLTRIAAAFDAATLAVAYSPSAGPSRFSPVLDLGLSAYAVNRRGAGQIDGVPLSAAHRTTLGIQGGVDLPLTVQTFGGLYAGLHYATLPGLSGRAMAVWRLELAVRLWPQTGSSH